ncbi:glycosyltransferase family 92 protein [Parachlamydia sp. AcF125]|uniref:glycosyltransferase family 92 protein n=1 Tax=Parachlamydia sp. AcF125 TaxID=2795736 RepID=UPI001BC9FAC1|nr:glycosyltransferase family 92 protein [Parachlamydia sp. AcF125]MBS4168467.1 hypothetical protein [Parachlamydia sp. AcF125]
MLKAFFSNKFPKLFFYICLFTFLIVGIKKASKLAPQYIPLPFIAGLEKRMEPSDLLKAGLNKLSDQELSFLNQWIINHPLPLFCGKKVVTKPSELEWVYTSRSLQDTPSQKYFLSVGAIIQNEAIYLKEWIEYHKLLGAEHFWIYNHLSTDHYLEVLEPYIRSGEVELIEWGVKKFPACQLTAYEDCLKQAKDRTEWLALIDVDEFFVPHQHPSMKAFLAEFEPFSQILINWQLFGTSNIQSLPKNALLTEHLTYKFPAHFVDPSWNGNQYVKAIVRPSHVEFPVVSCHYFHLKPHCTTVNGVKQIVPPNTTVSEIHVENIQLNHYWFRTLDYFHQVKIGRRQGVGEKYPAEKVDYLLKMGHAEQDFSIQRFLPKLKEVL